MLLKNDALTCLWQHLISRGEHDNNKRGTGFVNKVIRAHVSKRERISLVDERKLDSQ
jgi:hypothetical protein